MFVCFVHYNREFKDDDPMLEGHRAYMEKLADDEVYCAPDHGCLGREV